MDAPEKMSSAELTQFVAAVVAETLAARPSPASIAAATLRRFAPSGCAGLVTVLAIAFPDLQTAIAANPLLTAFLASLGAILTHLAPSPVKK